MEEERSLAPLIEKCFNEDHLDTLAFMIGSCISADSLLSVEDCDKSIYVLKRSKEGFEKANIPEDKKKEYLDIINSGIEICERDREEFLKSEEE